MSFHLFLIRMLPEITPFTSLDSSLATPGNRSDLAANDAIVRPTFLQQGFCLLWRLVGQKHLLSPLSG